MEEEKNTGTQDATVGETNAVTQESSNVQQQQQGEQKLAGEQKAPKQIKPKMFSQEQVNDFVRSRLERHENSIYKKYGANNKDEFNELFGKAQSYSVMQERYNKIKEQADALGRENSFLKNGINPERYDDINAYFKGKELEFNEDALKNEIATHPEWLLNPNKQVSVASFGTPRQEAPKPNVDEKELASKMFGVKII